MRVQFARAMASARSVKGHAARCTSGSSRDVVPEAPVCRRRRPRRGTKVCLRHVERVPPADRRRSMRAVHRPLVRTPPGGDRRPGFRVDCHETGHWASSLSSAGMDAARLLADLVAIDSVNPALVPGAAGEAEIAAYVAAWLGDRGLEVTVIDDPPGRPSVVGIARGTGGGAALMLNGHIDTVGVAGMAAPHEPEVRDGRLYGRGAYDMKGGLAACMLAERGSARRRAARRRDRHRGGRRGARERGRAGGAAPLQRRRLRRHRADAPAGVRRAQGLRVGRARDARPRGARLAPRPRRRRDRRHGPGAERDRRAAGRARRAPPSAARPGQPARLAHRRRPGAVELSRALRAGRRAPHAARRAARRRRG